MADENDNSLYMAGGNKIFNLMQKQSAKQEEIISLQEEEKRARIRDKAESVASIKKIAVTQDGKPLTTTNIVKFLENIATTITNRVGQMSLATVKEIGPIASQLKRVDDLMSSNRDGDLDKGFELIDKLQSKLGLDLGKYSKEMQNSIQKLYDMNNKRKAEKAEKITELETERELLREQGINTYINEKTLKLEIKSKKEEKAELKRIQTEEKRIQDEQKRILGETKDLKKLDPNDKNRQDKELRILAESENLFKDRKKLEEDKKKANIQPDKPRTSGMLDQTVGEAFRQIKTFGKEIVQLGGDLFKGFGKLAGMVGKLALGFIKLVLIIAGIMLIFLLVGLVIYGLYKIIKSVIDFFANIFDGIAKIWPFSLLKKDDAKNKEVGDKSKTMVPGEEKPPEKGYIEEGRSVEKVAPGSLQNRSDAMADGDKAKILPINAQSMQEGDTSISNQSYLRTSKSAPMNLNKMSVENQASSESKSANNTVIAPNVSNSSVSASNTQAMTMEPTNFDRSFINLNSVPI